MKEKKEKVRKVISSSDPEEYEQMFNETTKKLAEYSPEMVDIFEGGRFTTVFTYTKVKKIPQNAKDRFNLEGMDYLCISCPYLERGENKAKKTWRCPHSFTGLAREDGDACNIFYEDVANGIIEPKGVEEDEEETD